MLSPASVVGVSRSITQGRRAGVISLAGVAVGFELYVVVKLAGACYLGWLACRASRPGGVSVFAPADLPPDSARRLFAMGLTTSLLNLIVLAAGTVASFLAIRPTWLRAQRYLMGTVLGALAVRLVTDHARPSPARAGCRP